MREQVVSVARSWISTPFHDCAAIKGVGVDCARLCEAVYAEAGAMEPLAILPYSPQWYLHQSAELFVGYVEQRAHEISVDDVGPGDTAIFKYGRCYSHGAIVVAWPSEIIHAWKGAGCVLSSRADAFDLKDRDVRFFSLW